MNIAILILVILNAVLNLIMLVVYYKRFEKIETRLEDMDFETEEIKENLEELATASNDADKQINELLEANDDLEGELADTKSAVEEAHLKIDIVASREHGNTMVEILPMLPKKREPN